MFRPTRRLELIADRLEVSVQDATATRRARVRERCTGDTYNNYVKMTFAKGAALQDPSGLFNSSLDGNTRRAIDFHEGEEIDAEALKTLVRAAVTLNTSKAKR